VPRWVSIENSLRRTLARNVREAREGAALTLHTAAERAEIHWRHWQKVEAGEANATLNTVAKLAAALNVEPLSLLTPKPHPEPEP
jgi:transcriptional regulator with XRE-family HTH domain